MEARYTQSLMNPHYVPKKSFVVTFSEEESLAHYYSMSERVHEAMERLQRDSPQSEPLSGWSITE